MAAQRQEEVFDVIVVGGGGSGLAAAIEARVAGARIVVTPEDHFIDMPLFAGDLANRNNPRESC